MQKPYYIPDSFKAFKIVSSLSEYMGEHDWRKNQLVILPRKLAYDFNGFASLLGKQVYLGLGLDIPRSTYKKLTLKFFEKTISDMLSSEDLELTEAQKDAGLAILEDLNATQSHQTCLYIESAEHSSASSFWHEDSGFKQGRILCSYNGLATHGVPSQDTKIDLNGNIVLTDDKNIFGLPLRCLTRHACDDEYEGIQGFVHIRLSQVTEQAPRMILKGTA